MNGKVAVVTLGVVILLGVVIVLGTMPSQRAEAQPPPGMGFGFGEVPGRYTVVKVADVAGTTVILLLDTATGELYRATADDAKPFRDRPRHGGFPGGFRDDVKDKDGPFRDKRDFDKDRPFRDFKKDDVKDGFRKDDKDFRKDGFRKDDPK